MKNRKYADTLEDWDFEVLRKLNDDAKILTTLDRLQEMNCLDASGVTALGSKVIIELKARSEDVLKYGDVFIESKKVAYLLLMNISEGFIPLYVNFIGKTIGEMPKQIIIWKMTKLSEFEYFPQVKTYSNLYQRYEYNERFGLKITDAAIYEPVDGKYTLVKCNKQQTNI